MFLAVVSFFSLLCQLLIYVRQLLHYQPCLNIVIADKRCVTNKIPMMGQVPWWAQTTDIGKQAIGI